MSRFAFMSNMSTKENKEEMINNIIAFINSHKYENLINITWEELEKEVSNLLENSNLLDELNMDGLNDVLFYKFYQCDECGDIWVKTNYKFTTVDTFDDDDIIFDYNSGVVICNECYENGDYIKCCQCDSIILADDSIIPENGYDYYCQDCADRYLYVCSECGCYYEYSLTTANEGYVSEEQYCEHCLEMQVSRGDVLICEDCGRYFTYDYIYPLGDYYYCEDCRDNHDVNNIHDYYYKPYPVFYQFNKDLGDIVETDYEIPNKLFMGIELECVCDDNTSDFIDEIHENKECYCKHDGSLPSVTGVEIVTHPCNLDYYEQVLIPNIIEITEKYHVISHNNGDCGLHIHCNRNFFGKCKNEQDYNILKTIFFIDKEWNNFVKFSRRYNFGYCEKINYFYTDYELDNNIDIDRKKDFKDKVKNKNYFYNNCRYKAINLQNENTVEFRLWRGSVKKNTVLATIEFTYGLVNVIKTLTIENLIEMNWNDLIEKIRKFFEKENRDFSHIEQYLNERGMTNENNN